MDIESLAAVRESTVRCDGGSAGDTRESASGMNAAIQFADRGHSANVHYDRDSTGEPAGCLCSAIQPGGGLRCACGGAYVRGSAAASCFLWPVLWNWDLD